VVMAMTVVFSVTHYYTSPEAGNDSPSRRSGN